MTEYNMFYIPTDKELNKMSFDELHELYERAANYRDSLNRNNPAIDILIVNIQDRLNKGMEEQISYTAQELLERVIVPYEAYDSESTRRKKDTKNKLRQRIMLELMNDKSMSQNLDVEQLKFFECDMPELMKEFDERYDSRVKAMEDVAQAFTKLGHVLAPTFKKRKDRRIKASLIIAICVMFTLVVGLFLYKGGLTKVTQLFETITDFFMKRNVETFEFIDLQDYLDKHGIDSPRAPTWLPEGYELYETRDINKAVQSEFSVIYKNNENYITITVIIHTVDDEKFRQIEKDAPSSSFECGGNTINIYSELDLITALWTYDNYEFDIQGNVAEEEIIHIIKTMYSE